MYDVSILNGIPFIVQRVERFANKMVFFWKYVCTERVCTIRPDNTIHDGAVIEQ